MIGGADFQPPPFGVEELPMHLLTQLFSSVSLNFLRLAKHHVYLRRFQHFRLLMDGWAFECAATVFHFLNSKDLGPRGDWICPLEGWGL